MAERRRFQEFKENSYGRFTSRRNFYTSCVSASTYTDYSRNTENRYDNRIRDWDFYVAVYYRLVTPTRVSGPEVDSCKLLFKLATNGLFDFRNELKGARSVEFFFVRIVEQRFCRR